MEDIVKKLLDGDIRSLGRVISQVENQSPSRQEILSQLYPHTGSAYVLGITGAPGSGKSSLTDQLIVSYRKEGKRVGVIAVDPTSPFTGGAILGDRIRMQQKHALDKGVYIRSMAARGSLGGLSAAAREAVLALDAAGMDLIIVETVGVGQSEVDIVDTADTTLVVLTPAGGDSVQTLKAGIMEIADIFVVNKADLDGVDRIIREVNAMLDMSQSSQWRPPVVPTTATVGGGMEELCQEIELHRSYLLQQGVIKKIRADRARREVTQVLEYKLKHKVFSQLQEGGFFPDILAQVVQKTLDPYTAADLILQKIEQN